MTMLMLDRFLKWDRTGCVQLLQ